MAVLYTLTNTSEYLNLDGIVGTSEEEVSLSLKKVNIVKLTKKASERSIGIEMLDKIDYWFQYSDIVDPLTGVAYTSFAVFEAALKTMSGATYTATTLLVNETNLSNNRASGDAGGSATLIVKSTEAFSIANIAVGYKAYQTTDSQNATISSVDSVTNITTSVLTGSATWASKAYSLPVVKRYAIDVDEYKFLTIHWRLTCGASETAYLKLYGTLDAAATTTSDTGWVDLSLIVFGSAAGITVAPSTTVENLKIIDTPTPMVKYMVKLVMENAAATLANNSFVVFAKKG